ncbi:uncharacterized protein BX664DRAFT_317788 [Halteromyces radiatus]|uniref:uncharacterized protein n=1 Tax=Halteromyces radiatus TaxID=101107 RepID=UPI002220B5A0|nr:uncharacterized protein BX664DRAFT_317788 [Halteromyces radiatus]KAI8079895.1 hypothetical protein BX664DRAFT_317788 [Halteromyces radiatus]
MLGLLNVLLTSLSLELCIPIFISRNIDVFRWLAMKHTEDFANIGVESSDACRRLALFTQALHRHLNGLPLFTSLDYEEDSDDDDDNRSISATEILCNPGSHIELELIDRTVTLFDHYTRPNLTTRQRKSLRWSSTLSVLGESVATLNTPATTTTNTINETSTSIPPPPYEDDTRNKSGLIKRLSFRSKRKRPLSMPANWISSDTTRMHPLRIYESSPTTAETRANIREQRAQYHLVKLQETQQKQQQRDMYLRKRWEKCRSCVILPREEEGREELPAYNCTVYKMGHVFVKKEKDGPDIKSRRRSWKLMYVELWGTILRLYHAKDATRSPTTIIFNNENKKNKKKKSDLMAAGASYYKGLFRPSRIGHGTSGVHLDQGSQLLFRLGSHIEMISWIEHLQAAINISLDLELRPMPKFMTLPNRLSVNNNSINNPRALQLEQIREQRQREQYEILL